MYHEQLLVILHVLFFAYCHVAKACCSFQVEVLLPVGFIYMLLYSSLLEQLHCLLWVVENTC